AHQHGIDSVWYRSHVLAEIPEVAGAALLEPAWLDACTAVPRRPGPPLNPIAAIDLGEGKGRDRTVILGRDEKGMPEVWHSNTHTWPQAAEVAAQLCRRWGVPAGRLTYDKLGVGNDFGRHLAAAGVSGAQAYCGEAGPKEPHRFANLRTEAAWHLR